MCPETSVAQRRKLVTMNDSKTASALYVSDPLSEVTRKVRRSLLGVSILSIAVVKAGLLPGKITALGIELSIKNQQSLTMLFSMIVGYFLITFIVYSFSDFIAWKLRFVKAYDEARQSMEKFEKEKSNKPDSNISIIYNALKPKMIRKFIYPTSIVRGALEFILPVAFGAYSVFALHYFTAS